nr:hypothetical protein [Leuven Tombus-like virus 5]
MEQVTGSTFEINPKRARPCRHTRLLSNHYHGHPSMTKHHIFQSCSSNEFRGMKNRHVIEQLGCNTQFVLWSKKFLATLELPSVTPMSEEELIESRPARMKKRYTAGLAVPFDKKHHTRVSCFIKNEKMDVSKPKPRCINFRNSIFTANLAKWTVPIEKLLSHFELKDNGGVPFMSKGRNAIELGRMLHNAYQVASKRYIHLVDHSAYDGSITVDHIRIEESWYHKMCTNKELSDLIKLQRLNKITSRNGVKAKCKGVRMSGDANTSLGNSVINYVMLRYQYPDAVIIVNGDDSVIYSDQEKPRFEWSEVGMVSKTSVVTEFIDLEYCQSKPVFTEAGWVMMRDPFRTMSRMAYRLTAGKDSDWFHTLGVGELHSNPYDPFMQAMANGFLKRGKNGRYRRHLVEYRHNVGWVKDVIPPTILSTISWQTTFSIDSLMMRTMVDMVTRQCCYDS